MFTEDDNITIENVDKKHLTQKFINIYSIFLTYS